MFSYTTGPVRPIFIQDLGGDYHNVLEVKWIYIDPPTLNCHPDPLTRVYALRKDGENVLLFSSSDEREARSWLDSLANRLNGIQ